MSRTSTHQEDKRHEIIVRFYAVVDYSRVISLNIVIIEERVTIEHYDLQWSLLKCYLE